MLLAVMMAKNKTVLPVVSRRAWQQSLPELEDDFPDEPLDGRLGGVVVGLPGQH